MKQGIDIFSNLPFYNVDLQEIRNEEGTLWIIGLKHYNLKHLTSLSKFDIHI